MEKGNKVYWFLGFLTESLHAVYFFALIIFGRLWLPQSLVIFFILVAVAGQVVFGYCPLTQLGDYFFKKHNPEHKRLPSSTVILYTKYGRWISIPIIIILFSIATLIGMLK